MNKKYLSVNSDDFGLSPAINRGVADAFQKGILTDASIMANGPAFEQAVDMALEFNIPIAAHINLLRGRMLSRFQPQVSLFKLWRQALDPKAICGIEGEVRAQIEKILSSGLTIFQINSEKHSHFFPPLFRLWLRLAQEYQIPCIRFIREFNIIPSIQGLKANLLSLFSLHNRTSLLKSSLKTTTCFKGILVTGKLDTNRLGRLLRRLPAGWTELMVHVGYQGKIDRTMGAYFLGQSRETELGALINPQIKGIIEASRIILMDFGGRHGK